jgi:1-acyl-sn-glycerol-3-phosphate acyltransferase
LEKGLILAMFPEGTRSRGRGLSVAKTGAARLAIEKNVPIVPVAINGSRGLFRKFPHISIVSISICAPILPDDDDDPLSLTDRVMFSLANKLPREMRGAYSEIPSGFKQK